VEIPNARDNGVLSGQQFPYDPVVVHFAEILRCTNNFQDSGALTEIKGTSASKNARAYRGVFRGIPALFSVLAEDQELKKSASRAGNEGFLREVRVLTECKHPNIEPLLGYSWRPFVRVFYARNPGCLKDVLQDASMKMVLGLFSRLRVIASVLSALSYLHQGGSCNGAFGIAHG
jgi:serine/threonine protein kinase